MSHPSERRDPPPADPANGPVLDDLDLADNLLGALAAEANGNSLADLAQRIPGWKPGIQTMPFVITFLKRELHCSMEEIAGLTIKQMKFLIENAIRQIEAAEPVQVPLIEQAHAVLTPNQARIFEFLWSRGTASYDTLRAIPRAFQEGVTDEAITKQLKDMRTRLEAANLPVGYIEISTAKKRITLERPPDSARN